MTKERRPWDSEITRTTRKTQKGDFGSFLKGLGKTKATRGGGKGDPSSSGKTFWVKNATRKA